jgi:uncharacterized protein YceH (UPF0502 family)
MLPGVDHLSRLAAESQDRIMEFIIGLVGTMIVGAAGWGVSKLRRHWDLPNKVDQIEEDVKYLRERFDDVVVALIDRRE